MVSALFSIFFLPETALANDNILAWKYTSILSVNTSTSNPPSLTPLFLYQSDTQRKDPRIDILRGFLDSHNSPLAPYSSIIVSAADRYGLDWKLLTAISGVESSFGKVMPRDSYNAYGWSNGSTRFESWEKSIEHVSQVLGEKYIDKGLRTPDQIMKVYCPGSDTWAKNVARFMQSISEFTSES